MNAAALILAAISTIAAVVLWLRVRALERLGTQQIALMALCSETIESLVDTADMHSILLQRDQGTISNSSKKRRLH